MPISMLTYIAGKLDEQINKDEIFKNISAKHNYWSIQ